MLFWFHLIYLIVFIGMIIATACICPQEKEKLDCSSKGRKKLIAAIPYIFMGAVWLFPLGNAIIRADSFLSFCNRFSLEFITASFLNLMIFFICTKTGKMLKGYEWVPFVLFFGYTLVKNFAFNGFWMGLLAQALAIATLIVFALITLVLNVFLSPKTKAELEQEAKEQKMQEQQRMQEYERARANSPYRYTISTVPTGNYSSSTSSSSSNSSSSNDRGARVCRFCYHYQGGTCNCEYSHYYKKSIWDPDSNGCNYYY